MEEIYRNHFRRCFWSKAKAFCAAVRFVLAGVKPALLIDFLPPDKKKMEIFFMDVQKLDTSARNYPTAVICLLELFSQDLIVINVASYVDLAKRVKTPVLLDVSEARQPRVLQKDQAAAILSTVYCNCIIPPLVESGVGHGDVNGLQTKFGLPLSASPTPSTAGSRLTRHAQSNPDVSLLSLLSAPPTTTTTTSFSQPITHSFPQPTSIQSPLQQPAISPTPPAPDLLCSSSMTLFSMSVPPLSSTHSGQSSSLCEEVCKAVDVNLCTVFGCWLQYPAVYWFNAGKGHGLDMEELTQYVVEAEDYIPNTEEVCYGGEFSNSILV